MENYDKREVNRNIKNLVLVNSKNKFDFKTNFNILDINDNKLPLKNVLYGNTFRSIRKERKSMEQLQLRHNKSRLIL